jgi:two-component system, chemotaxis family, protein-glutamate methylesterase/glutaminase
MTRQVRVLVCEDSPELRELLADRIARHPALEVAGRAGDAAGAVRLAAETLPDVVLLDLLMPGAEPDVLVLDIARSAPAAAIAIFSGTMPDLLAEPASGVVAAQFDKTTPLDAVAERVAELGRAAPSV